MILGWRWRIPNRIVCRVNLGCVGTCGSVSSREGLPVSTAQLLQSYDTKAKKLFQRPCRCIAAAGKAQGQQCPRASRERTCDMWTSSSSTPLLRLRPSLLEKGNNLTCKNKVGMNEKSLEALVCCVQECSIIWHSNKLAMRKATTLTIAASKRSAFGLSFASTTTVQKEWIYSSCTWIALRGCCI